MSTDSWVNAGPSMPSGATTRRALAAPPRYRASPPTSGTARFIRRGAAIVVACLIEAVLILGFVVASLGLGYESHSGVGPGRPPPVTPAPAPPPGPAVISQ
jgi:hypothetical protein